MAETATSLTNSEFEWSSDTWSMKLVQQNLIRINYGRGELNVAVM